MAENAANFTPTYQTKPSIFEVIAQKTLNDTLYPALQKVALFLATNFPQKFSWLNDYYDESFLALSGLLQYHYLNHYDASFSENFYGLKRVLGNDEKLTKYHKELSLLLLVLSPYFKRKVEERITFLKIENAEGYLQKNLEGKLKTLILFLHSSIELVWSLYVINNYIRYMSGQTQYQTSIFKLINVKLTYDVDAQLNSDGFWSMLFRGNLSTSVLGFNVIKSAISTCLEVGAFFLQFLQTWQQQKSNYNVTDLPTAEPPSLGLKSKNYEGKCPICLKPWIIPTVLQVSGYIFCFRCILRFLNEKQKCPVTNLPAKPLDIVRLYVN